MRSSITFERDPVLLKAKQQSNFRALKNLVEAESHIRVAHNRIKVLQINENKNVKKIHNQLDMIKRIQKVRQSSKENDEYLQNFKNKISQEKQQKKAKFLNLNESHKHKIKQIYQSLQKQKKRNYQTIQEEKQEAQKMIVDLKNRDLRQKQKIHEKILNEQEKGKHNLKQNKIKQIKKIQIINIKCKQRNKKRELKDLSNIEMQLIQKQSQSQSAYIQIKNKLDSLLNRVKSTHHMAKKSLQPSFHSKVEQYH